MGYYSNGTSVNLYNGASSRYPTSGGTYACQKGKYNKMDTPSYKLTVSNIGGATHGSISGVYYSDGTKIGDRLIYGTSTYTIYGSVSGYNEGTATNFYADGTQMYYGGNAGTASNPYIYIKVGCETRGTNGSGQTLYCKGYLKVDGSTKGSWGGTTAPPSSYGNYLISSNTTIATYSDGDLGNIVDAYIVANKELRFGKSGSTSQSWTTSSGSTKSLHLESGYTVCYFHYRSTGNTTTISFTGTSWSGSQKVSYSSTSYCNITSITRTKSACSFTVTKGTSISYTIYWSATAYSERD